MRNVLIILASALLLAGNALAQTPPADAGKGARRGVDCSKAADPKACEERRARAREAMRNAHKACEGKQGAERRECMSRQMCARAKNPAKCEARAKERAERREKRRSQQAPAKS